MRTLLVPDCGEQVVEATPEIAALLARCPRLAILATSRVARAIRGVQSYAVEPLTAVAPEPGATTGHLAASPAVALFVARAVEVRPGFELSDENAPVVAEICRRLDGLPLAIELAAARVRLLSPEALLGKMTQRLPLLTGGARDLPDRQRTLREAIAWSHDLLGEDERTLFRRLSVFAGGCGFEAIEAVCNPAGAFELLDMLGALVDKNLVRQVGAEGEPTFRMLETIREFAGERLEASGEALAVRRAHLDYYIAIADAAAAALRGPNQVAWLGRLDDVRENLRTALAGALERREQEPALRLASALFWFWHMRGDFSEGRDWLERALAGSEHHGRARIQALNLTSVLSWTRGDFSHAGTLADDAYAAALACGDKAAEALALLNQGVVAGANGDASQFVSRHEAALRLFRDLGDSWAMGVAIENLGGAPIGTLGYGAPGDSARSTSLLREAIALFRNLGDGRMIA
jgi:predicted ATPase